jgi:hypothetical protein
MTLQHAYSLRFFYLRTSVRKAALLDRGMIRKIREKGTARWTGSFWSILLQQVARSLSVAPCCENNSFLALFSLRSALFANTSKRSKSYMA